jgi:hypothetical protein
MRPFAADVVDTLCGEASRDAENNYYTSVLMYEYFYILRGVSKLIHCDTRQQTKKHSLYQQTFLLNSIKAVKNRLNITYI